MEITLVRNMKRFVTLSVLQESGVLTNIYLLFYKIHEQKVPLRKKLNFGISISPKCTSPRYPRPQYSWAVWNRILNILATPCQIIQEKNFLRRQAPNSQKSLERECTIARNLEHNRQSSSRCQKAVRFQNFTLANNVKSVNDNPGQEHFSQRPFFSLIGARRKVELQEAK